MAGNIRVPFLSEQRSLLQVIATPDPGGKMEIRWSYHVGLVSLVGAVGFPTRRVAYCK
jgi:hypothetical protein